MESLYFGLLQVACTSMPILGIVMHWKSASCPLDCVTRYVLWVCMGSVLFVFMGCHPCPVGLFDLLLVSFLSKSACCPVDVVAQVCTFSVGLYGVSALSPVGLWSEFVPYCTVAYCRKP